VTASAAEDGNVDERVLQLEQHRADVALAAIMAGIEPAELPDAQQGQTAARVQLTMPLSTLLGLDDEPGHLDGHGAVPAAMARRLASHPDSTWQRLLTDPESGRLLDYGRTVYRPPADLRDFVIARDSMCAFPGCQQPACLGDLDHIQEWDRDHGKTDRCNMAALCRRHHTLKTRFGWAYIANPDGSWSWTSPIGRTRVTRPPRRWPHPDDPAGEPADQDGPRRNEIGSNVAPVDQRRLPETSAGEVDDQQDPIDIDGLAATGFHPGDPISYIGWLRLVAARPHVPVVLPRPSADDDPPF
jgi:hypothetical protein